MSLKNGKNEIIFFISMNVMSPLSPDPGIGP